MTKQKSIAVIGGGPAGLMAAEQLFPQKTSGQVAPVVTVYDSMPTVGRKLLMAGKSGLNLTHSEDWPMFKGRYSSDETGLLSRALDQFTNTDAVALFSRYGIETFTGSSGRIFPNMMKAAPFLRAWIGDLTARGVKLAPRHRLMALSCDKDHFTLTFNTPNGQITTTANSVILACGGGSWARLGSDGSWTDILSKLGIKSPPFIPSNCGFKVNWSDYFKDKWAGEPVKSCYLMAGVTAITGDFVISHYGIEGSAVYGISRAVVRGAPLYIDLSPKRTEAQIFKELSKPRGKNSLSNILRKRLNLRGVKVDLLRECLSKEDMQSAEKLATTIKACPIPITGPQPTDEAISTAGGLPLDLLDDHFMVKSCPGLFAAGEMLNWDAPTGGYLLTACWATGKAAGKGAADWLHTQGNLSS